jgi:hypothetical protein
MTTCPNPERPARVSGRSTWGPLQTNRAALAAWPEELFAAGEIDASQLRRGSGDLRTQIAGIDTVLARGGTHQSVGCPGINHR